MKFDFLDMLSLPGKRGRANEDAFSHADRLAAVFDGATMLGDPVLDADSDAAWIARHGAEGVIRHDVAALSAMDILQMTASAAERNYLAQRIRPPSSNFETPFASMMLLRLMDSEMDALWFGDCAALIKPPGAETFIVGETLTARDAESARARNLQSDANLRSPEVIASLRASRDRVNKNGPWLFAPDASCAAHAHALRVPVQTGTEILVASDGFLALVSDYHCYTIESLMAASRAQGLKRLFTELREIEGNDPNGKAYPRFKQSDDATAILFRIV